MRAGIRLTDRELEVLKMAACGLSNARIADALHLAEATVKRHLANVYQKAGAPSPSEAMVMPPGTRRGSGQSSAWPL